MIVLDTDILTLLFHGHANITQRMRQVEDRVAITVVSRIEILRGRFDSLLKAANGAELQRGQQRLAAAERDLARLPKVLLIDAGAAAEFDRLRKNKRLKKIGRADLLIAAIALAHRATVVTGNAKHFRAVPGLSLEDWIA